MVTAEQLRAARAMLQMDQAELAKISGVSVETIKRLERQTGKLHAKIETISAIQKAFETKRVEFLGDHYGGGAGVRLVHPDKLRLLRGAFIGQWALMMDQWIKQLCESDPQFFEHGEKRLIAELTELSVMVLPAVVSGLLKHPDPEAENLLGLARWRGIDLPAEDFPSVHVFTAKAGLSATATIRAKFDAGRLTGRMLGLMEDASDLGSAGNRAFVRAFVDAIPASDRGTLTNAQGTLSAEGMIRSKNAVLAKAYDHADILSGITESSDTDIKSITNGLLMAAPQWAAFRADIEAGRIPPDLDKTRALVQAVKHIVDNRLRGQKLEDCLAHQDASDRLPKAVEDCIRMFYNAAENRAASAETIAKKLRRYAEESAKISKRGKSSRK